jgi:uncharacterized protein YjbI with pentapeptide repeats
MNWPTRVVYAMSSLLVIGLLNCTDDVFPVVAKPTPETRIPTHFQEHENSADNPAYPEDVLVMHFESHGKAADDKLPDGKAGSSVTNTLHYTVPTDGKYELCIEKDDPYVTKVQWFDGQDQKTAEIIPPTECETVDIKAGSYRMVIHHDGKQVESLEGELGRHGFVSSPPPASLGNRSARSALNHKTIKYNWVDLGADNSYWAIKGHNGRFLSRESSHWSGDFYPIKVNASDAGHSELFSTSTDANGNLLLHAYAQENHSLLTWRSVSYTSSGSETGTYTMGSSETADSFYTAATGANAPSYLHAGNYQFRYGVNSTPGGGSAVDHCMTIGAHDYLEMAVGGCSSSSEQIFTVAFRYYPDGTQIDPLEEGEVAIFDRCDYEGHAFVFAANTPDFSALDGSDFFINNIASSIKLGPDTTANLYADDSYKGRHSLVISDVPCLDRDHVGDNTTSSLTVSISRKLLVSSNSCTWCNLRGAQLSRANLSKANLSHSFLDDAVLDHATLTGANLSHASVKNANLDEARLGPYLADSYATPRPAGCVETDHHWYTCPPVFTNLKNANFSGAQLYRADLTMADASSSTFDNAHLSRATLTGTAFNGASMKNADLSRAHLYIYNHRSSNLPQDCINKPTCPSQVPRLDDADLTGANLTDTISLSTDLTRTNFTNATMNHTNLARSAFTCTNFTGVDMDLVYYASGAKFLNTDTCRVKIDLFSTAKFHPSTWKAFDLTGATIRGTNGSNLEGTDLSGIDFKGAMMSRVHLEGANLSDADFRCDGEDCTDLTGAYLQGANLQRAKFDHAQILGADFQRTDLTSAVFTGAKGSVEETGDLPTLFDYALMHNVTLDNGQFVEASFTYASIYAAMGENVSANGANFTRANFSNAILSKLNLTKAKLQEVNMSGANLVDAILGGVSMKGATLTGAYLQGAHLEGTDLSQANLANANVSCPGFVVSGDVLITDNTTSTQYYLCTPPFVPPVIGSGTATITDVDTVCIDGSRGAETGCSTVGQWTKSTSAFPSCVPKSPDWTCPHPNTTSE